MASVLEGRYQQALDKTLENSSEFTSYFDLDKDDDKADSISDLGFDTDTEQGVIGQAVQDAWGVIGDVMDTKSAPGAGLVSKAGQMMGFGPAVGVAYNAATNTVQGGWTEGLKSLGKATAQTGLSMLSKLSGAPIGQVFGKVKNAKAQIDNGMAPADAMIGAIADLGIDIGGALLGGALGGPVGAIMGSLLGGFVDVTGLFDGFSESANSWGREAQVTADVGTRKAMATLGLVDDFDFEEFSQMMASGNWDSINDVADAYGDTDVSASAGYEGATVNNETGTEDDPNDEGWGLGSENGGYGPGASGPGEGSSGGSGQGEGTEGMGAQGENDSDMGGFF